MERLALAIIGCGGMGHRHLNGLMELEQAERNPFELVAAVDVMRENAESLAAVAEERLGKRPAVFESLDHLPSAIGHLQAVDVCTDPRSHHTIAVECLRRGWHVMVEKPMGLTVRACNRMVKAARESGLVLSVAENYRRDPINRLAKALLDAGVMGTPRLLVQQSVGGGDRLFITSWRHLKNASGLLLDTGVHYTDMVEYLLGDVERVTAQIRLHEKVRRCTENFPNPIYGKLHELPAEFRVTAEDACYALLEFQSGAVGHYTLDHAGHGQGMWQRLIFGSKGFLSLPADRSGRPMHLALDGQETLSDERLLDFVPDFRLDEATTVLFGGDRLWRYDQPFEATDRKLIAVEYAEFGNCILTGTPPEVDATVGARAVALCYAMLESGTVGRTVTVKEVANGQVDAYQREMDEELGLI